MEKHLRFGVWLTKLSHPYHNFPTSRSRDLGAKKHSRTGRSKNKSFASVRFSDEVHV